MNSILKSVYKSGGNKLYYLIHQSSNETVIIDGTPTKPIGPVGGHGIKWTVAKTILTMTSVNEPIIISIIISCTNIIYLS